MKDKKKKKLVATAALLAIIAVLSGTFAWLTDREEKVNRTTSAAVVDGSVTVEEIWEPTTISAGSESGKRVTIKNSGGSNVFVRVSYEEVLKHLASRGAKEYASETEVVGAKYDPANPGDHEPVRNSGSVVTDNTFTEVPLARANGLPADGKVRFFVKGKKTQNAAEGQNIYNAEAKMIHEYANGEYQDMSFKYSVTADNGSEDAGDWTYDLSELKYGFYRDGYEYTVANWAQSSLPNVANNNTGYALLGTSGNKEKYGYDYDYRETALGLALPALPGPVSTPIAANDQDRLPESGPTVDKGVQADLAGLGKNDIRIRYGTEIVTPATLADGKWVYNPTDGWFYYTEALTSGQSTPELMQAIVFATTMGEEYTNATYDLIVKMEAIQAKKAALTDAAGWGMNINDANTSAIVAQLNQTGAD